MVQVTKYGDWNALGVHLATFGARMTTAIDIGERRAGQYLIREIKKGIQKQKPTGGRAFEPLHWFTKEQKGSSKALVDKGDLANSVTSKKVRSDAIFVGVHRTARSKTNQSLVMIAQIQETGIAIMVTDKMRAYLAFQGMPLHPTTKFIWIPPRPFLSPVFNSKSVQAKVVEILNMAIMEFALGRITGVR